MQTIREWADSKQLTFHIQRYPGVNLELDFAVKTLCIHDQHNPEETTKVTIFVAVLTYSDYFYAEGMTECDIKNWIRVNNNALAFFGGVTPIITPDNVNVVPFTIFRTPVMVSLTKRKKRFFCHFHPAPLNTLNYIQNYRLLLGRQFMMFFNNF